MKPETKETVLVQVSNRTNRVLRVCNEQGWVVKHRYVIVLVMFLAGNRWHSHKG